MKIDNYDTVFVVQVMDFLAGGNFIGGVYAEEESARKRASYYEDYFELEAEGLDWEPWEVGHAAVERHPLHPPAHEKTPTARALSLLDRLTTDVEELESRMDILIPDVDGDVYDYVNDQLLRVTERLMDLEEELIRVDTALYTPRRR